MSDEDNRGIFYSGGTAGTLSSTVTIATGSTTLTGRAFGEYSSAQDSRTLLLTCADDNSSTPTIAVSISLKIGDQWSAYTDIETASAVPKEVKIDSYGKSWWYSNQGVTFKITKSGAGAVTMVGTWK
jgi:hypothetical protein